MPQSYCQIMETAIPYGIKMMKSSKKYFYRVLNEIVNENGAHVYAIIGQYRR